MPEETETFTAPARRKVLPSASMCQPASMAARTTPGIFLGANSHPDGTGVIPNSASRLRADSSAAGSRTTSRRDSGS